MNKSFLQHDGVASRFTEDRRWMYEPGYAVRGLRFEGDLWLPGDRKPGFCVRRGLLFVLVLLLLSALATVVILGGVL